MSQRMIYQIEETRENILRVAEGLFLERGFFNTQMKDVADAVGVSRNTLYRYFRDKGDLGFAILDIVINRTMASFRDALSRADDAGYRHANGREKLIAVLSDVILGSEHETELRFMAEFDTYYSGERIPADFDKRQDLSQWQPIQDGLQAIAREGIADGSIRSDIEPEFLIWLIMSAARVLQRELLTRGKAFPGPGADSQQLMLPTLIRLIADGLRPRQ